MSNTPPENLLDLTRSDAERRLLAFTHSLGLPDYRARQVADRLWKNPAGAFSDMTELPVSFRDELAGAFTLPRLEVAARQRSVDGTEKFLFRLADGEAIETVAIPDAGRLTLCILVTGGVRAPVRVLRDRSHGVRAQPPAL